MSVTRNSDKTQEQKRQERQRLLLMMVGGAVAIIVVALLANIRLRPTPITDPSYYTGNFMNHNGDVVSPDGKIVERAKPRASRQSSAQD